MEETEPEIKRRGPANPRRALEKLCERLESPDPGQRPEKLSDCLLKAADIRLQLMNRDTAQKSDHSLKTITELQVQHDRDAARITALEAQALKAATQTIRPSVIPDGPTLREEELTGLISLVQAELSPYVKACIVIKAIKQYGPAAARLAGFMKVDFQFYWLGVQSNPSAEYLKSNLSRCTDSTGMYATFYRAALAVLYEKEGPVDLPQNGGFQDDLFVD